MHDDMGFSAVDLFSFFELTPDLVCIADKTGYLKKVNPAVIAKLGYTEEELYAMPISSFIHPDDRENTQAERTQLLEGRPLLNFQNRYLTKDGRSIWLEWTSIYSSDKEVVFAIAKDVTLRKETEKDIADKYQKFKSLATHFKKSIEEERKYLAVELHEELAQLAAVLKLDIEWIKLHEQGLNEFSEKRLEHALAMADLLLTTIRRISFSISPKMLEDIGLRETLRWHCNEFAILNGIPCQFEDNFTDTDLAREVQMDFFRICQEALNNVTDHAQATRVKIGITAREMDTLLFIEDDGIGFEQPHPVQTPGLTNMQELAASINAGLTISSSPGRGTKIELVLAR